MLEPTTATGAAAASAIATGTLTIAGSLFGIPAEAIISSVVGAGIAMGRASKAGTGIGRVRASLMVFVTGMGGAIFLGPLVAFGLNSAVSKLFSINLPDAPLRVGVCFLVAMGAQKWLPALMERVSTEIATKKEPK
ncbi:hypothetical protein UFOVP1254_93 [uncultured Caudovirales phage]|uniref:Uncharacterized protein n=1 Tax=uncultured Caudovirales phage TaxID=2100421 RepID=A0A6J5RQ91_9CAUD|nr:hypothetical protein UFOVP1254_93 [uncultured Caudovirales phage]